MKTSRKQTNEKIVTEGEKEMSNSIKPEQIIINGPPRDDRCQCCGKHISELKPYGGPGDPLRGDFSGATLVKNYRPFAPHNEEAEKAVEEAEACCGVEDYDAVNQWLINKYGREKTEEFWSAIEASSLIEKSWECRDCFCLYEDEYFEKFYEMLNSKDDN